MASIRKSLLALVVLSACNCATAQDRTTSLGDMLAGKRILHVAAHPDDESLFAPMLAEACRFRGATCHLVVAAEEDSMGCLMSLKLADAAKCTAMRRKETAASAANLNATHEAYGWRDLFYTWNDAGLQSNLEAWARDAGGRERLVARFRQTLDTFKPDVVLGFDPRHGTTCHPNHRAVVQLALEAIAQLPESRRPQVWLESDIAVPTTSPPEIEAITKEFGVVRWPGDEAPVTWYDATIALPDGRTGWDYLVDALRLNATQFPEVATGKLTPAPAAEHRRIPFVRLQDIDPLAKGWCEKYTPDFPYTDKPGANP